MNVNPTPTTNGTHQQIPQITFNLPKNKSFNILFTIICLLIIIGLYYFNLPVFSFKFASLYISIMFALLLLARNFLPKNLKKVMVGLAFLSFASMIVFSILSQPLFRSADYRNLLGQVKETEFQKLISPINLDQIPIVDPAFALSLAEKKLGDDFALGSRVILGNPTRQMINGHLYFAIPLLHSGFFKWLTNREQGTPGFIIVSATNPQDIQFIRDVNGKPVHLIYQPNSFWDQNLKRIIYMSGIRNLGIGDFTFELDDQFHPWWTVTIYDHKIGLMGSDAIGTAIVNPETGNVTYYDVKDTPGWVDRIQPSQFVMWQLDFWGNYIHGFWNTMFGKRDMLMTTEGYNVIYGTDNKCYFYTGMTSVGADEGAVGFMLVNTRNKETHFYKISGATETAAMSSAEGKVQNFKYSSTFPILLNVSQIPTFFMTLKDTAGLVKMYAMVSVKDFSLVGVGESVEQARDAYINALSMQRNTNVSLSGNDKISIQSTVTRIGSDIKNGRSFYYVIVASQPNIVFIVNTDLSDFLPVTNIGDPVQLEFLSATDQTVNLLSFTNLKLQKGKEQEQVKN
eukprot:TRINITY_DN9429_c0_g1_i1.p1 TRINITY_DN9429_c0_g1~~TRINITY_DN9429_c0_g1_i1.p1  ORF type:complete len:568 (-),score=32.81 TRINITY_DN9429_c0_g1_i1:334-2037(-)